MTFPRFAMRWMLPAAIVMASVASAQTPPPDAPAAVGPPPGAQKVPRSLDVPDNALVAAGAAPELELLYTGDVIGYIEPCG
jgi:hypothetical protein